MWNTNIPWAVILMLVIITMGTAQEDSLQSALNAVDRRQRDLTQIPGYKNFYTEGGFGKYYVPDDKDDLAFLKPVNVHNERKVLERALLDYLEDDGTYDSEQDNQEEGAKKHFSSSFRERIEKDKTKQREELEDVLINKLENEPDVNEDNEEYLDLIQQLYEKYRDAYPELYEQPSRVYPSSEAKKRLSPVDYYTNLGYNSVGMKKRSRYFEPDGPSESLYLMNYAPRDELFERLQEEDMNVLDPSQDYYNWNVNKHLEQDMKRDRSYLRPYSMKKRFPVTKRSSPSLHHNGGIHQHKRSSNRGTRTLSATDPKVAKELSNVFGVVKTKPAIEDKPKKAAIKKTEKPVKPKKTEHDPPHEKNINKNNTVNRKNEKRATNIEIVPNVSKEEPLQIKKKSIDWSDYFGYDRKKKSDGDIDNEWLMERYHKAIAMATKRTTDYPLQNFRNHDEEKLNNVPKIFEKKADAHSEEAKLGEMDSKLKNIEDSIVDEALKYTGAHEGTTDSKEIQEIKDKVIARLAAAYSLEKMRQALGEYKQSIAKQRKQLKESGKLDDMSVSEEKRVSVPRKQAVDEERERTQEEDNSIKCSQGDEDCEEQNYRAPSEILEEQSHWTRGRCPKVQRACNEVADVLGNYGRILESACNMHQTCLLCGENSWFAPTRQCNVFFLSKADEVCDGDLECRRIARHSVRYLLDINRSLRPEPSDECDLLCPDNRR